MAGTPEIDLTALHAAIKTALVGKFQSPTVKTVDYYTRRGASLTVPAIFFELTSIEPSDAPDIGTEQFDCVLSFSAYVVFDYKAQNAKLAVRALAANVAKFINKNKWSSAVQAARIQGVYPDDFDLSDDRFEVQRIDWQHEALLGTSIWDTPDFIPSEVYVGFDPLIGPSHVSDYLKVAPVLTLSTTAESGGDTLTSGGSFTYSIEVK